MGSPDLQTVRRAAAVCYFFAMLLAGLFVYWLYHDQHTHATPQAIPVSVFSASVVAGAIAWACGGVYLRHSGFSPAVIVPVIVLVGATVSASVSYYFAEAVFRDNAREIFFVPEHAIQSLLSSALVYLVASAPVWAATLALATILVRTVALSAAGRFPMRWAS